MDNLWQTNDLGLVLVSPFNTGTLFSTPEGAEPEWAPVLPGYTAEAGTEANGEAGKFKKRRQFMRTLGWWPLVQHAAAKYNVPESWVYAVIFSESAGINGLTSSAGAAGLMQIMPNIHTKHTLKEYMTPAINVDYGTSLLGGMREKGNQLPESASMYNAGQAIIDGKAVPHPSVRSAWGMRENTGYIDSVVQANNSYIDYLLEHDASELAPASPGAAMPQADHPLLAAKQFHAGGAAAMGAGAALLLGAGLWLSK